MASREVYFFLFLRSRRFAFRRLDIPCLVVDLVPEGRASSAKDPSIKTCHTRSIKIIRRGNF